MKKILFGLLCILLISCEVEEGKTKSVTIPDKRLFIYNTLDSDIEIYCTDYKNKITVSQRLTQSHGIPFYVPNESVMLYFYNTKNEKIEFDVTTIKNNSYIDFCENEVKLNNNEYVYFTFDRPRVNVVVAYNQISNIGNFRGVEYFYSIGNSAVKSIDINDIYYNSSNYEDEYIRVPIRDNLTIYQSNCLYSNIVQWGEIFELGTEQFSKTVLCKLYLYLDNETVCYNLLSYDF